MLNILRQIQRKGISLLAPALFHHYFSKAQAIKWPNDRKFAATISFDYDFPEDVQAIPSLLDLLDSYDIPASHACIGKFIEQNPRLHEKILERKDEIINHTYSHPNNETFNPNQFFNKMTEQEQEGEIIGFEKLSEKILNYKPIGFRTPHFGQLNTQSIYNVLERRGYLYSSSTNMTRTKSYGLPYYPSKTNFRETSDNHYKLLEMPMMSCPEHYFPLLDSWHCFRSSPPAHDKEGEFLKMFTKALDYGEKYGLYLNFYFDPRDVTHKKDFELALRSLTERNAWIAKTEDVAKWMTK